MLGYSVGALALVVLMSALNGFESSIFSSYQKSDADFKITAAKGKSIEASDQTLLKMRKTPGIEVVSRTLEGKSILQYGDQQTVCKVVGVDEYFFKRIQMDSLITAGKPMLYDAQRDSLGGVSSMAILSEGLVYRLGVGKIDEPISLLVVDKASGIHSADALKTQIFIPSAIVQLPEEENDHTVFISAKDAGYLYDLDPKKEATALEVRVKAGIRGRNGKMLDLQKQLQDLVGSKLAVFNQQQQHPIMYKMFNTEKWISFAILTFVLMLISFNLVGALMLMVLDKRNDFILFRNLGMQESMVGWIVFWEGVWVSICGSLIGIGLGVLLVVIQQKTGIVQTQGTFNMSYPVELRSADIVLILILNVALGAFSAIIPARRAAVLSNQTRAIAQK
ncbi:MAG: ABC transporter permease [Bacteroidetes bacterium]|nr:ABC transporter permease [Bacteroidota bacterium]MDA1224631.1 ABC transporter permease [Bacteroidota bacterium]